MRGLFKIISSLLLFYYTENAQHHISDERKRKKEMRIPGPAGNTLARATSVMSHQSSRPPLLSTKTEEEEEEETTGTIATTYNRLTADDDDDDDDERRIRERRANEGKNERGPRQRHSADNGTTTKKLLWQTLFNQSDQRRFRVQTKTVSNHPDRIKKGGWRSGRLNKGRFIVEKMKEEEEDRWYHIVFVVKGYDNC